MRRKVSMKRSSSCTLGDVDVEDALERLGDVVVRDRRADHLAERRIVTARPSRRA